MPTQTDGHEEFFKRFLHAHGKRGHGAALSKNSWSQSTSHVVPELNNFDRLASPILGNRVVDLRHHQVVIRRFFHLTENTQRRGEIPAV